MKTTIKEEHKVIALSVAAVLLMWVGDAAYEAFIYHEGPFLKILMNVTHHDPFFRLLLTSSFLAFGIIIAKMLSKHNRVEETFKQHSAAIESSMDGIAIYDRDNNYIYVNQAYASVNGYAKPEEVIGKSFALSYAEKELERMDQVCIPALQKSGRWRGELVAKRKNGSTYYQEASATMLEDGGRVCIIRDITWRKRSEERLRRSERFLNTIFNSIHDPFCIFDNDFRIIRINEAYAQLKNKTADDLIGAKCYEVLQDRTVVCEGCIVEKSFNSADPCAKDKRITLRDGTELWQEIYTYPILDEEDKVSHTIEYTRDITDRKKAEDKKQRLIEKLEHLSRTDDLTGLINRRALLDSLVYELDRAKRYSSELTLILCDIDNFKEINDTFGHDTGDRALQTISATLKTLLRKADIAGRHGGDEFMLILPETSLKGAESLADKLLNAVRNADLRSGDGKPIRMSMSIGISCLESENDSKDSFIKRADSAMYTSKQAGRDRVSSAGS